MNALKKAAKPFIGWTKPLWRRSGGKTVKMNSKGRKQYKAQLKKDIEAFETLAKEYFSGPEK